MLTGIRGAFERGFVRFLLIGLMALLVLSFAVWGVGDIFRGGTSTTLATVGQTQVTVQAFQTAYNRDVQNFGRMLGRGVTPDQARQFGVDRRVLSQLLTDATLDERARQLGLGVDDDTIRARILTTPAFRGPTGQFDRNVFLDRVRSLGFNEQTYIDYERRLALRQQIAGAVSDRLTAPNAIIESLARFQQEKRRAAYVVLGARAVGDIPAPDAATLQKYFEDNRATFRAPEYRKLVVVTLTPEEQAGFQQVPADRIEAEVARLRETAERRTIQQIRFGNADEAAAARRRLGEGLSFEDLAKERNISDTDLTLGTLSRAQVSDTVVRDAAFALAEGAVSEPVTGTFGTFLLRVTRVEPFDEGRAREEARLTLARSMARTAVNELHDRIERERATGLPLTDIATKVGVTAQTIEAVDVQGRDPADTLLNLVGAAEFLPGAFRADIGLENEPVQVRQTGAFIWFEVAGITPARDRTLDEVRDRVEARWREDEVKSRIAKAAEEMVAAINGGKTLAELAAPLGLEVKQSPELLRTATEGDWAAGTVAALFATAKGKAGQAAGQDGIDRIVFVTETVEVPANATLDQRTRDQLVSSIENDVLEQYISQLQRDFGTSVNQTLLSRAVGGGETR
ncbi:SurA N-terminal domain-containing protein [Phreatobacter sp.]|uniref:peptidylprolyl isomerase n=1 Tax=Phreatobacter sp. TaxID=1966341 RepID=UPI003F71D66C